MELLYAQHIYQRIQTILQRASTTSPESFLILLGAILACGIVYGFFGYRIYRWVLACFGACAGGLIAIQLLGLLNVDTSELHYVRLSLAGIFALVGGIIAPKLFRLFTFIIGGSALALALHPMVPLIPKPYGWLALIIGFAAGGFLAFVLMRPTLIAATAIAGTYICAVVLFTVATHFKMLPLQFDFILFEIVWGILALSGTLVQFQQKTPAHFDAQGQPTF